MEYTVRTFKSEDVKYVSDLHRRLYAAEYSLGDEFIKYATKIPYDFAEKERDESEEMWIAEKDGSPVGSIMICKTDAPGVGQVRLFAVEKEHRGYGVGKALTSAVMEKAKVSGYKELMLTTASPLTVAISHYKKLGFVIVERTENRTWHTEGELLYEITMTMKLK